MTDAWGLIAKLIEEATGMTGDQVVDTIRIERGAGYVRAFKREHPGAAGFLDSLLNGTPEMALGMLAIFNRDAARLPFAKEFLAEVQKRLKGK